MLGVLISHFLEESHLRKCHNSSPDQFMAQHEDKRKNLEVCGLESDRTRFRSKLEHLLIEELTLSQKWFLHPCSGDTSSAWEGCWEKKQGDLY